MIDKKLLFYDFECFKYDWMLVIIQQETNEKTVIINDPIELRRFYELHKSDIWIGYNSREYDQYILKGILLGYDPHFINDEIIVNGKRGWQILKGKDEFPLFNFDISNKFRSLKELEGFMGSNIKETDVPFDIDRKLTKEELDQTIFYCTHDVEETMKVFEKSKEEFDSQLLMIEAFDLPMEMFNKTKAQLAATVLEAKRGKDRADEFNLSFPDTLRISKKYQYIVDWYKNPSNHDYSKSLITDVAGVPHIFAWGGIHAAVPNYIGEGLIAHCDVSSLYPSIMIEYDLLSRNVQEPEKYKNIREKRLELKKAKNPMQLPMKIILNSTYGAMKDNQNALYDPRQANNVCVAGQLLILDLIEKLEGHCELIQSNTDGLFMKVESEEQLEEIQAIAKEWETRTRLQLEWGRHKKIVQKDVNNYILVNEDGTYESKGAYLKKLSDIDYDLPIVNKSLINYFVDDTPIEETILSCNSLREFQKIIKVSRLYKYALYDNEKLPEKVFRVFASTDEKASGIFKVKTEDRIEKIANTPEHLFIFNDDVSETPCPEELDKNYYVEIAKKRLSDFFNSKGSKTGKLKSNVKYVNFDQLSQVQNTDFSEYSCFTDLALFFIREHILNKKQLSILAKLDYFSDFGNPKELLRVIEVIGYFKDGDAKVMSEEKLNSCGIPVDLISGFIEKSKTRYKILDCESLIRTCENAIENCGITDYTYKEKIATQVEYTGAIVPTEKEEDRPILYVEDGRELPDKFKGGIWKDKLKTKSLGSGIVTEWDVSPTTMKKNPIKVGDVIRAIGVPHQNDRGFWQLKEYKILI